MTTKIQNNKSLTTNQPIFDSLALLIPLTECNIVSKELNNKFLKLYLDTNQTYNLSNFESFRNKAIQSHQNGYIIYFQIVKIGNFKTNKPKQYVSITLSSKILESNYFKGITKHTKKSIYKKLQKINEVTFSYKSFLNAIPTDIDLCENRYIQNNSKEYPVLDLVKQLYESINITSSKRIFDTPIKLNVGLQLSQRDKSSPTKPFIKLYQKNYEIQNSEFYRIHLKNKFPLESIQNLLRTETTIRSNVQKRYLVKKGIINDYSTFNELLNLPENQLHNILSFNLKQHITKIVRKPKQGLIYSHEIILNVVLNDLRNELTFKQILSKHLKPLRYADKKKQKDIRYKSRKLLNKLFDIIQHENLKLEKKTSQNDELNNYLNHLNITIF